MYFIKMHGLGNDYVCVDEFRQTLLLDPAEFARRVSDRHRGVGSDGLLVLGPSTIADFRMRIWNADGSDGGMCGNGLRCAVKYLFDERVLTAPACRIETSAGVVDAEIETRDDEVASIRIWLGRPRLRPAEIPVDLPGDRIVDHGIAVRGGECRITCVSVGNPHAILLQAPRGADVAALGSEIESHPCFPQRTNVEFLEVVEPGVVEQRTWERGVGETLACGTGAAASVVALALLGYERRPYRVMLRGGDLEAEWHADDRVSISGPAVEVFRGEWTA